MISQADKSKKEIVRLLAKEIRGFLDGLKIDEILRKTLKGQKIELKASISFSEKDKEKKVVRPRKTK